MSLTLELSDDMAVVLFHMLIETGGKEAELENSKQSLEIVGDEIEELREKLEHAEESDRLGTEIIKDCRQLIHQLRPDCYDAGSTLAGMVRKALESCTVGDMTRKLAEVRRELPDKWAGILTIYQVLCMEDDPYVSVEHKSLTGKGKSMTSLGLRSGFADGRLTLLSGSKRIHIPVKDIERMEIIEQDEDKNND